MSDATTRNNTLTGNTDPIFPPADAGEEPTDSNPVPMSPTKPEHRTSDGAQEPVTGTVVGVPVAGSQTGLGGIGVITDPDDPQRRVSHEQPGTEGANPVSSALDRESVGKPVER